METGQTVGGLIEEQEEERKVEKAHKSGEIMSLEVGGFRFLRGGH